MSEYLLFDITNPDCPQCESEWIVEQTTSLDPEHEFKQLDARRLFECVMCGNLWRPAREEPILDQDRL